MAANGAISGNSSKAASTRSRPRVASADRFFEFSLLGLLSSGYLAVAGSGYLDTPTAVLTGAGLLLRAALVAGWIHFHLSPGVVAATTLAYIGFYPIDYYYISQDFLTATVHLVFFLAVVKVLTARTNRDYLYVKVIAFLELLAASVLSTSLNFFVFLALFLLFGVATFSSWEIRRGAERASVSRAGARAFHWRLVALTIFVSLGILVLTLGMFFLLPRTAHAALQHLGSDRFRIAGFSNEVTLGQIGELKRQSTPVMHVRIEDGDRPHYLKWRGAALSQFDGRRWYNLIDPGEPLPNQQGMLALSDARRRDARRRVRIRYEVQLRELASDALFFAGWPEVINVYKQVSIQRTLTDSFRARPIASDGLRYWAYSHLEDPLADDSVGVDPLTASLREMYLRLPRLDPRVVRLSQEVTTGLNSDLDRAVAIEMYLKKRFGYTTELLSEEVRDPLAHFLFQRRKGHCEYFASAMAVMLRAIGIPSRVATGFQSGIFNPLSGWHLIRASDAHSWVEAYLPRRGWTTFDPTPPDPNSGEPALWTRLTLYIDAVETLWQDWVVNYDLERQMTLASRMEQSSRSFGTNWLEGWTVSAARFKQDVFTFSQRYGLMVLLLIMAAGVTAMTAPQVAAWARMRRHTRKVQRGHVHASDATILYERMLKALRRRGLEKPVWLTPNEFAEVLAPSPTAALVVNMTRAYYDLRYGGNREAAGRMIGMLEQLERGTTRQ